MVEFEQSVVINCPVREVFAFVSDLENDPPWTGAAEMRQTSQGPIEIGTKFRQCDRFLGRRLNFTLEVTAFEPNHSIGLKTTSGLLSFGGTRIVEPVGDDATRVTFVGGGHAHGIWRLVEPLLAALGARRLRTQLGRLKQLMEARS